jgi:hypothetical protein
LRIVQSQAERGNGRIVLAGGGRQGVAESGEGGGVAAAVAGKQFFGLLLEMPEIGPCGNAFHMNLRA